MPIVCPRANCDKKKIQDSGNSERDGIPKQVLPKNAEVKYIYDLQYWLNMRCDFAKGVNNTFGM